MLFNIPDLDEVLQVKLPICCKLCEATGKLLDSHSAFQQRKRCIFCSKMKQAFKALIVIQVEENERVNSSKADKDGLYASGNRLARTGT